MAGRKEQAAASRASLVEAARACFAEQGYDATTVAAVFERAHVDARPLPLLSRWQGGIFSAVFELVDGEYHARRDAMLNLPTAVDRLKGGVNVFLELCTDDGFARIVLAEPPDLSRDKTSWAPPTSCSESNWPTPSVRGSSVELDVDVTAMALYGAIRSAGEFAPRLPQGSSSVRRDCRGHHPCSPRRFDVEMI